MKYIVWLVALVFVCVTRQHVAYAQEVTYITALSGIRADVRITFPHMDNVLADRALSNFIARQTRLFTNAVRRVAVSTGSVWSFVVDCRIVNATGDMRSVLCDVERYVYGTKGEYVVRTFTVRGQTGGVLMLWDLLSANRIVRMRNNIYNHLVYTLQATDEVSHKRIKDALSAINVGYSLFTVHFERKPSIILYVTIPWFEGIQPVRVSYPEGKIMK